MSSISVPRDFRVFVRVTINPDFDSGLSVRCLSLLLLLKASQKKK